MFRRMVALVLSALSLPLLFGCSDESPTKPKAAAPVQVVFAAPTPIATTGLGGTLSDLVVADLNDDARPDLAVGMVDSLSIWVRYAAGGGAFSPAKVFYCGVSPSAVAAANVTGSGLNDLVIGGDSALVMLPGLAGDNFGTPDTLLHLVSGSVRSITCADFDRDGVNDIACIVDFAGPSAATDLIVISGATRIVTAYLPTFGGLIVSGDATGDVDPDLVVAGGTTAGVIAIYAGLGNGSFASPFGRSIGEYPLGLATADLNLDGALEVGIAHGDTPGIWTVRYIPPLTLEATSTYAPTTSASAIASGDLNLDGRADFAASSLTTASAAVLVNHWDGTLEEARYFPAGGASNRIAIADIDGDGRKDLVVAGPSSADGIRYLRNTSH